MESIRTKPVSILQMANDSKKIRDYLFAYSVVDINTTDAFTTVFPRTGHLIFTFCTGDGSFFESRFVNYDHSVALPNHMYISGLFSESSLLVRQIGHGGAIAMKVHPVIGYHFLKIPMYELTDRQIRICKLIDGCGLFLENVENDYRINSFDNPFVRKFFTDALPPKSSYKNDPIYHAVNEIARRNGNIKVHKLAQEFCMSERTFHRQFLMKVGLPPQAYAKIWQIQHAMELIRRHPHERLEQIAFDAGYYDVAHMARDFKNKVSLPPSELYQTINPLAQQYLDAPGSFS